MTQDRFVLGLEASRRWPHERAVRSMFVQQAGRVARRYRRSVVLVDGLTGEVLHTARPPRDTDLDWPPAARLAPTHRDLVGFDDSAEARRREAAKAISRFRERPDAELRLMVVKATRR